MPAPVIRIGYPWIQRFQFVNIFFGNDELSGQILSTDKSNPCIITTKQPHQLSSGKIWIDGVRPNVIVNGNHDMIVTGDSTFTLTGIQGEENSQNNGILGLIIDASTYTTFAVAVKTSTVSSPLTNPICTISWNDQSLFDFTLTITATESAKINWQNSPLVITVSWIENGLANSRDILVFLTKSNPTIEDMPTVQPMIIALVGQGVGGSNISEALTATGNPLVWTLSKLPKGAISVFDGSGAIYPTEFSVAGMNVTFVTPPVNPFAYYSA